MVPIHKKGVKTDCNNFWGVKALGLLRPHDCTRLVVFSMVVHVFVFRQVDSQLFWITNVFYHADMI
jgi:hypothetical protein